jgi:hypothetical protein
MDIVSGQFVVEVTILEKAKVNIRMEGLSWWRG